MSRGIMYRACFHELRKIAAFGGDLRRNGMAGVPQPAFPTEDSKGTASQALKSTQTTMKFDSVAKPKTLIKPGPTIQQIAATPQAV